jgi:tetratricopeptide (TPR) repeat protein
VLSKISSPNILAIFKIVLPSYFWLIVGLTSLLIGCGLLSYAPSSTEEVQEIAPPDAYRRGTDYFSRGLYRSAVKELETLPPDYPRIKQAREYIQDANSRIEVATVHLNAALAYREQKEFFQAKKEITEAFMVYPKHDRILGLLDELNRDIETAVNFYYEKGQQEFEQKNYREARAAYLEALRAAPKENRVQAELSRTNKILAEKYSSVGTALFEKGFFDEAVNNMEQAYEVDPADPMIIDQLTIVYNRRALKYYREEKLNLAVEDLKRSLQIKPEQAEIQNQLTQVERRLGLLKKIEP